MFHYSFGVFDLLTICDLIHLGHAVGAGLESETPRHMPPAIYQMVHGHQTSQQPPVIVVERPQPKSSYETLEEAMRRYGNRL